jgi:hypothetical protein
MGYIKLVTKVMLRILTRSGNVRHPDVSQSLCQSPGKTLTPRGEQPHWNTNISNNDTLYTIL